ncbi:hypothetical protein HanIR_Chr05g0213001 [Helianthus annuus]|nr:hypothetical protein HanIR_Chr05g0213001 [Helianthus annuus]
MGFPPSLMEQVFLPYLGFSDPFICNKLCVLLYPSSFQNPNVDHMIFPASDLRLTYCLICLLSDFNHTLLPKTKDERLKGACVG